MDEDKFNISVRKFLKVVGVTAQREIEKAVREALNAGRLKDDANLKAKMTLEIGVLGLTHSVEKDIELGWPLVGLVGGVPHQQTAPTPPSGWKPGPHLVPLGWHGRDLDAVIALRQRVGRCHWGAGDHECSRRRHLTK
jgi:hypothetical protein